MNVDQVFAELGRKQVVLSLHGDGLHYRAPEDVLSEDIRAMIAEHREAIIDRLRKTAPSELPCLGNCVNCNPRDWKDHPPKGGLIRTTCRKCGHFIGYRPENL